MDFDPTRRGRDVLTLVVRTPTLHKGQTNNCHFRQLVAAVEAFVDAVVKKLKSGSKNERSKNEK